MELHEGELSSMPYPQIVCLDRAFRRASALTRYQPRELAGDTVEQFLVRTAPGCGMRAVEVEPAEYVAARAQRNAEHRRR